VFSQLARRFSLSPGRRCFAAVVLPSRARAQSCTSKNTAAVRCVHLCALFTRAARSPFFFFAGQKIIARFAPLRAERSGRVETQPRGKSTGFGAAASPRKSQKKKAAGNASAGYLAAARPGKPRKRDGENNEEQRPPPSPPPPPDPLYGTLWPVLSAFYACRSPRRRHRVRHLAYGY